MMNRNPNEAYANSPIVDVLCNTFSIVACDRTTGALGVAVASKAFAVGSLVPWVKPGVGAIATQALTSTEYGWRGLDLLSQGLPPREALAHLLQQDQLYSQRQIGIVDTAGRTAVHTGNQCLPHAVHKQGSGVSCQGNLLNSPEVVEAMLDAFVRCAGKFEHCLLAALRAGQDSGGDRRGKQSAALLVHVPDSNHTHRGMIDLRVDDHDSPITELQRLLNLYDLYYSPPEEQDWLPVDGEVTERIRHILNDVLDHHASAHARLTQEDLEAFERLLWQENLSEHMTKGSVDRRAIEYLERRLARQ